MLNKQPVSINRNLVREEAKVFRNNKSSAICQGSCFSRDTLEGTKSQVGRTTCHGGKGLHESVQNILQTYHKSLKTSVSVHTERSRGYDVQLRAFAANEIKYGAIKRVMGLSLNN